MGELLDMYEKALERLRTKNRTRKPKKEDLAKDEYQKDIEEVPF